MSMFNFFSDRSSSATPASTPSSSSELFQSTSFDSTTGSASSSSVPPPAAPSASDLFASAYDPSKLHPLANLGLEVLDLQDNQTNSLPGAESALPSRGWTDELCYGTGTTYLSGAAIGGLWGSKEGLSRPLGTTSNFKLRLNAVLNGCTRRGSYLGNQAGVIAIFYNIANSSIDAARGKHDIVGGMAAGAVSGAVFKASAGLRPALVAATLMTAGAGTWSWAKTRLF